MTTVVIIANQHPQDELIERLRKYDGICVGALDEVDQLKDKSFLYELHRLSQFPPVLIANRGNTYSRIHGSSPLPTPQYPYHPIQILQRPQAGLHPELTR